jgi:hypothetical protein
MTQFLALVTHHPLDTPWICETLILVEILPCLSRIRHGFLLRGDIFRIVAPS